MGDDPVVAKSTRPEGDGLTTVLSQIARRLKSQPLLFGLAIAVLLAIMASLTLEGLRALTTPLLVLFGISMAAWLVVELRQRPPAPTPPTQGNPALSDADVVLRARNVGRGGQVTGIEGMPASKDGPMKVHLDVEGVDGKITGASYGSSEKKP